MRRRTDNNEIAFGSDSFLDVVANIVGIVIILIVIAGLRISHAPIRSVQSPESRVQSRGSEPERQRRPSSLKPQASTLNSRHATTPAAVEAPAPQSLRRAAELQTELAVLKQQADDTAKTLKSAQAQHADLRQRLASQSSSLDAKQDALSGRERHIGRLRDAVQFEHRKYRLLQSQLEAAERLDPPVKTIRHKLTPVSRLVHGKELHFRLAGGQIAFVPLEELIERLRAQVLRQKDWLVKFRRHEGVVGPVEGFSMHYVVERETLSVVEELQNGYGTMRIGVSEWQIQPESNVKAESLQEALQPGSAFLRAVYQADPNAALTFWVYPDSFSLFRRLQTFAHEQGLTVAARPLPFGTPIAGSPRGTRSAGQ